MLPDIDAQQGLAFDAGDALAHEGIVLVGGGDDFQFAAIEDEPGPTGAEPAETCGFELLLEGIEGTKGAGDGGGEFACGRAALAGGEEVPEEGVVPVTATVVADGAADGLGDGGEIGDEGLDGFGFEIGLAGDGLVEVVHVGLVMAAVVDFHGGGVDVGFQGFLGIGKRSEFVRHTFVGQSFLEKAGRPGLPGRRRLGQTTSDRGDCNPPLGFGQGGNNGWQAPDNRLACWGGGGCIA